MELDHLGALQRHSIALAMPTDGTSLERERWFSRSETNGKSMPGLSSQQEALLSR